MHGKPPKKLKHVLANTSSTTTMQNAHQYFLCLEQKNDDGFYCFSYSNGACWDWNDTTSGLQLSSSSELTQIIKLMNTTETMI